MGARQKLNDMYGCGTLVAAVVVGLIFQSWLASVIVAGVLLLAALDSGDIRPNGRRR